MGLRAKRLRERLAKNGLERVVENDALVFEKAVSRNLWSGVRIETSGTRGEADYAFSCVSAVPGGWPILNYIESNLIGEIATIRDRGWTIIDNDEVADDWEIRLRDAADDNMERTTAQYGASVLDLSFAARDIAEQALECSCDASADSLSLVPKLQVLQITGHWEIFSEAAGMLAKTRPDIEGVLLHGVLHVMVARMLRLK